MKLFVTQFIIITNKQTKWNIYLYYTTLKISHGLWFAINKSFSSPEIRFKLWNKHCNKKKINKAEKNDALKAFFCRKMGMWDYACCFWFAKISSGGGLYH